LESTLHSINLVRDHELLRNKDSSLLHAPYNLRE
jgi:hypothetical protein